MSKPSPQLTSQRNTDIMQVTSLLQNIHMYSQQIYTTTHKILALPNLNVLPHFGLAIWRRIIYAVSISSPYINAENTKKTNRTLLRKFLSFCSYGCTAHLSPDMNKKICCTKAHFQAFSSTLRFLHIYCRRKLDHIDTARLSYKPVHMFTKSLTQRFWFHLATANADIKQRAVAKGCSMIQPSCC